MPLEHRRKFISTIWVIAYELRTNVAAGLDRWMDRLGKRNDHNHWMSTPPHLKCSS